MLTKIYRCERCGGSFINKEEAEKCEANHVGLDRHLFLQAFRKGYKYPYYAILLGNDGKKIKYEYVEETNM